MDATTIILLAAIVVLLIIIVVLIIYVINTYCRYDIKKLDTKINTDQTLRIVDTPKGTNIVVSDTITGNNQQTDPVNLIEQVKAVSFNGPSQLEILGMDAVSSNPNNPDDPQLIRPELEDLVITQKPNPVPVLNNNAILNYDRSKIYDPLVEPTRRVDRYELPKYYFKNMIDYPTRGYPDNYSQLGILVNASDEQIRLADYDHSNLNYSYDSGYDDTFDSYYNQNYSKKKRHSNKRKHKHRKSKNFMKNSRYNSSYSRPVTYNSNQNQSNENKIIRLFGRQDYPGSNKWDYYITVYSGLDAIKIPLIVRKKELYTGDRVYVPELNMYYRVNLFNYDAPRYYPDLI